MSKIGENSWETITRGRRSQGVGRGKGSITLVSPTVFSVRLFSPTTPTVSRHHNINTHTHILFSPDSPSGWEAGDGSAADRHALCPSASPTCWLHLIDLPNPPIFSFISFSLQLIYLSDIIIPTCVGVETRQRVSPRPSLPSSPIPFPPHPFPLFFLFLFLCTF